MENNNQENKNPKNGGGRYTTYWIYGVIAIFLLGLQFINLPGSTSDPITFERFAKMAESGDVKKVEIVNQKYANVYLREEALNKTDSNGEKTYKDASRSSFNKLRPHYTFDIGPPEHFASKLDDLQKELESEKSFSYTFEEEHNWLLPILSWIVPIGIFIFIWFFIMRRVGGGAGGPGGNLFSIGKSKATLFDQNAKVNVTFQDVAGLDEAKEEVVEVVDFLKNPKKYTSLGGKIPKGVLLVGPPGTGKTLLAKAVAGEAEVPFFSISGSDFVEMFVGVGASRVRDLFKQAREKAPCIVFIDEIDAIGRARGRSGFQGGNDERENTLNQLLVEMDGFPTDKGVILIAATNRPDVLDNALMRPGRFDRLIAVDRPDLKGRESIFKVHLKNIKIAKDVSPMELSEMTPGFAGAEIANVCNEAALIAARRNKAKVGMQDFHDALDRVIGGLEKKSKLISPEEKQIIAYHEAGHAVCGWFLEHASPLVKVTIVPRGIGTLGYAQYLPKEEYITRTEQLHDRMCMTFGGRAAEEIVFGKISTGAQSDLDQVTKMAYSMITVFGMNDKVGQVSFYGLQNDSFLKPYSEETAHLIDEEVRQLVKSQFERAKALLRDRREELEVIAQRLLEKEVLTKSDVEKLIGKRPFVQSEPVSDVVEPMENGSPVVAEEDETKADINEE